MNRAEDPVDAEDRDVEVQRVMMEQVMRRKRDFRISQLFSFVICCSCGSALAAEWLEHMPQYCNVHGVVSCLVSFTSVPLSLPIIPVCLYTVHYQTKAKITQKEKSLNL